MDNPISLYLVSGFLGSGKTTFLRHILSQTALSRVGVIVNEFGSVGIDGKRLRGGGVVIEEINDGSIFCACLKDGFVRTLAAFLEKPVDMLFVEASGMADPSNMERLLEQLEKIVARKGVKRRYRYRGSVCIVDAKLFPRFCELFEPTRSQVEKSAFLVVNKSETVTPEELMALHRQLEALRPDAEIFDTSYGRVPLEMLERFIRPEDGVGESMNAPANRPEILVVETPGVYTLEQMRALSLRLQKSVIRGKGFFHTEMGIGRMDNAGELISVEEDCLDLAEQDFCLVLFSVKRGGLEEEVNTAWADCVGGAPVYHME